MSGSSYASAVEKLKLLASFAETHPDTTAEKLFDEVVREDALQALRWLNRDERVQFSPPPLEVVVALSGAGLVDAYFDTAAGQIRLDISQKGRAALANAELSVRWDRKLLTALEAKGLLSVLEHLSKRSESQSWMEDD